MPCCSLLRRLRLVPWCALRHFLAQCRVDICRRTWPFAPRRLRAPAACFCRGRGPFTTLPRGGQPAPAMRAGCAPCAPMGTALAPFSRRRRAGWGVPVFGLRARGGALRRHAAGRRRRRKRRRRRRRERRRGRRGRCWHGASRPGGGAAVRLGCILRHRARHPAHQRRHLHLNRAPVRLLCLFVSCPTCAYSPWQLFLTHFCAPAAKLQPCSPRRSATPRGGALCC